MAILPCLPHLSLVFPGVYLCQPSCLETSVEVRLCAQCWVEHTKQVLCFLVLCAVSVSKKNAGLGSFSCCSVCSQLCAHTALGLLCFPKRRLPLQVNLSPWLTAGSAWTVLHVAGGRYSSILLLFCSQMLCFLLFLPLFFPLVYSVCSAFRTWDCSWCVKIILWPRWQAPVSDLLCVRF